PQVRMALDEVLAETRGTSNPCKVSFSVGDYEKMEIVSKLLAPIMELTNCLQADGVTSSLIIPGLTGAYKAIETTDVSNVIDGSDFQVNLRKCLRERFSCEFVPGQDVDVSRRNRITRDEVFGNPHLVLATMLDPRFKNAPFEDTTDVLNSGHTSGVIAVKILEERYQQQKLRSGDKDVVVNIDTDRNSTSKRSSLFCHLEKVKTAAQRANSSTRGEIQRYMDLKYENESSDPLEFWKEQMSNFPILSQLARIYLGFPASSGSAERLFSIAGALQRLRRSRLKWSTIEQMLCYCEMRLKQLFSKKEENWL
ncbi:unnamed protein product, partial [Allacma fusca]